MSPVKILEIKTTFCFGTIIIQEKLAQSQILKSNCCLGYSEEWVVGQWIYFGDPPVCYSEIIGYHHCLLFQYAILSGFIFTDLQRREVKIWLGTCLHIN